ncbi:hypothetical protein [Micromonospora haikouensis]|uniref:hypothetical protein n=1 Tax=Micromonospora haikouensis TaxID=686309 RepID=UPI003D720D45
MNNTGRRTALCHPRDAVRVREILALHGMEDQVVVVPSKALDPGRVLLLDPSAATAHQRPNTSAET